MAREGSWTFDPNRTNGGAASALGKSTWYLWYIKAVLTGQVGGLSSGVWTMAYSSNASTASTSDNLGGGTYNSGNWTRAGAGTNHSYFVLKSPTQDNGSDVFVVFDWSTATDYTVNISIGRGTLSPHASPIANIPTFTSSVSAFSLQLNDNVTTARKAHCGLQSNGSFYILDSKDAGNRFYSGIIGTFTTDNDSADPYKFVLSGSYATSGPLFCGSSAVYGLHASGAGGTSCWRDDGTATAGCAPGLHSWANNYLTTTGSLGFDPKPDGTWAKFPIRMSSGTTGATLRPKGRLVDFYQAGYSRVIGSTIPSSSTEYTNIGGLWAPWTSAVAPNL